VHHLNSVNVPRRLVLQEIATVDLDAAVARFGTHGFALPTLLGGKLEPFSCNDDSTAAK